VTKEIYPTPTELVKKTGLDYSLVYIELINKKNLMLLNEYQKLHPDFIHNPTKINT